MFEYITLILSFVTGGGLSTIFTMRYVRRSGKIDFADKAISFMERQNTLLMKRVSDLENEVKQLRQFKCERPNCDLRIN